MTRRALARIAIADRAVTAAGRLYRATVAVATAVTALPRWGLTDLYAAVLTARFTASHHLIEQAADLEDDDTTVVVARTWPWFGAAYVYEEDDQ